MLNAYAYVIDTINILRVSSKRIETRPEIGLQ